MKPADRFQALTSAVSAPATSELQIDPSGTTAGQSLDGDRLRAQDAREFARLVEQCQSTVAGLCQAQGLRGADIDEAMTDVFSSVFLALPAFKGQSQVATWVYRIAIRVILKSRRRWRRRHAAEGDIEKAASPAVGPSELAASRDDHARLWQLVEKLDARQSMAVELYYRQGWEVQRIAAAMDCPANTVKTLLARARERLKTMLQHEERR